MPLEKYVEKRRLDETREPKGGEPTTGLPTFVVQLHRATRLHHDFRLEAAGVLKSWAVPKGPSMNPADKRLAVMVEDHPMDYRMFEGIIPKGNYGAGTVMVWDEGTYATPDANNREEIEHGIELGLHKGHVTVFLSGHKLKGLFDLIQLKGREENAWLLVKREDEFSTTEPFESPDRSVITGRTLEEIKAGAPSAGQVWYADRKSDSLDLSEFPEAPMPHDIKPMLASEVDKAFDREGWLFEIKWDGFRAIAEVELEGDVRLYSRNGNSFADRFPVMRDALKTFGHAAVLDGEIVTVDVDGKSQFQWLQDYGMSKRGTLLYYVFDLLYVDGHDLREAPLKRRKEILRQILESANDRVRVSDHVSDQGRAFFEAVVARECEGVVAKNGASAYEEGRRSHDWQKIKRLPVQSAVIGGFTEPRNSRRHFGALVLGVYDGDNLHYVGHTGSGFDESTLASVMNLLEPLRRDTSPFEEPPKTNSPVTWVEPRVVCSVVYRGWTDVGNLRQPVFKDLLLDVDPHTVHRESRDREAVGQETSPYEPGVETEKSIELPSSRQFPAGARDLTITVDSHALKLTNLDKVFWPDEGYTKGSLIDYYRGVSEFILPYLRDRPQSLKRQPNGIKDGGFFQKDTPASVPPWLTTIPIESGSEGKVINYLLCQDEATLIYMANLGCIEINPWNSRLPHLEQPDYALIDLDPHEVEFAAVVETALAVKQVLDALQVPGYPKTSGATGLHIYVPMGSQYETDQVRQFAELIAQLTHSRLPDVTSLERSPARRVGKVYIDFLQNRQGQTLASAYSVRPFPGATVSTPLKWEEVGPKLDPTAFTIRSVLKRFESVGDLWEGVLGPGIDIGAVLGRIHAASQ